MACDEPIDASFIRRAVTATHSSERLVEAARGVCHEGGLADRADCREPGDLSAEAICIRVGVEPCSPDGSAGRGTAAEAKGQGLARRPRILDPACGDGVFLLAAASWLWEQWSAKAAGEQKNTCDFAETDEIIQEQRGKGRSLTSAEVLSRVRLVLHHLYGVDKDMVAVRAARWRLAWWAETGLEPPREWAGGWPLPTGPHGVSPAICYANLSRWVDCFAHNIRCADALIDLAQRPGHDARKHKASLVESAGPAQRGANRGTTGLVDAESSVIETSSGDQPVLPRTGPVIPTPLPDSPDAEIRSCQEVQGEDAKGGALAAELPGGRRTMSQDSFPAATGLCWEQVFPEVFADGGFDAIVGNPPYVNIRLLTQTHGPELKAYYRDRFQCARGAYDLFVIFLERMLELMRDGGRGGAIVPNKLATLDYAQNCRQLFQETTCLEQITDVTECRLFADANVYPYLLIWRKELPSDQQQIQVRRVMTIDDLSPQERDDQTGSRALFQSALARSKSWQLDGGLDVESRVPTRPLAECARILTGTAGFSAKRVAAALVERTALGDRTGFRFIVSGNIDRYAVHLGNVRFAQQRFCDPWLPVHHPVLTPEKRELYSQPKLVLAGLSRCLEVAYDPGGLAAGVQVYLISAPAEDLAYLLAILNSRLLTRLFHLRFEAKRLADGYLAVNKRQLSSLPIRQIAAGDRLGQDLRRQIVARVEPLVQQANQWRDMKDALPGPHEPVLCSAATGQAFHPNVVPSSDQPDAQLVMALTREEDRQLDRLIADLYGLSPEETAGLLSGEES